MNAKIYIGGLPYSVTEAQLKELFSSHGVVKSARVITDKLTGRSCGFGFVEMSSDEEAHAAIAAWNGKVYEGRTLFVNEAKPQLGRPGNGPASR